MFNATAAYVTASMAGPSGVIASMAKNSPTATNTKRISSVYFSGNGRSPWPVRVKKPSTNPGSAATNSFRGALQRESGSAMSA